MELEAQTDEAVSTVTSMVEGFFSLLPKLGLAIIVFIIFLFLAGLASRLVTRLVRERTNKGVGVAIGRLAYLAMLFAAFLLAVAIVTPSVGAAQLLSTLGVGSVAIGFAFRDILQNFLAGLLILLRQPFSEGDWIAFGEYEGTVSEISTRSTWLKTFDGQDVSIPNGQIFTNPVRVVTRDPHARLQYDFGIGYDADISKAKQIALDILNSHEEVLDDPSPDAGVQELGDSAVVMRVRWWCKTGDMVKSKWSVLQEIKEAFDKAGISIPYPHQQLVVSGEPKFALRQDKEKQAEKA